MAPGYSPRSMRDFKDRAVFILIHFRALFKTKVPNSVGLKRERAKNDADKQLEVVGNDFSPRREHMFTTALNCFGTPPDACHLHKVTSSAA